MLPVGFEPAFPANEQPQTHALDRAATAIGIMRYYLINPVNNKDVNTDIRVCYQRVN
jgi:hypothetical protein